MRKLRRGDSQTETRGDVSEWRKHEDYKPSTQRILSGSQRMLCAGKILYGVQLI